MVSPTSIIAKPPGIIPMLSYSTYSSQVSVVSVTMQPVFVIEAKLNISLNPSLTQKMLNTATMQIEAIAACHPEPLLIADVYTPTNYGDMDIFRSVC